MQINGSFNTYTRGALEHRASEAVVVPADSAGGTIGTPRAISPSVRNVSHGVGGLIASKWTEIPLVDEFGKISGILCRPARGSEIAGAVSPYRTGDGPEMADVARFVVHDINNLFAVIASGLRLLEGQDDAGHRGAVVGRMEEAITRGALLSRQLLETTQPRDHPINDVVDGDRFVSMVATLNQALRPDIAVRTEIAPDLWEFHVDPEELYFVLLNLCRNSADAMPNGGAITVGARNIVISGSKAREVVEIIVADDGEGMPDEVLSQALNPYFTTKPPGRGSGLGLPQVRRFAEQRGGSVDIESKQDAGTRVRLVIPRGNAAKLISGNGLAGDIAYRPTSDGGVFYLVNSQTILPSAD